MHLKTYRAHKLNTFITILQYVWLLQSLISCRDDGLAHKISRAQNNSVILYTHKDALVVQNLSSILKHKLFHFLKLSSDFFVNT